jgi:hypothetical protein
MRTLIHRYSRLFAAVSSLNNVPLSIPLTMIWFSPSAASIRDFFGMTHYYHPEA